ncbi:hypothetical protein [Ruminococcus sp.]|uniref:hypothetical protein n=1 Tax=Ruminococcus sp. TaxID=41978 RepID=UPI0025F09C74|nr:hypothetical protein [Ruminococcus sp.]
MRKSIILLAVTLNLILASCGNSESSIQSQDSSSSNETTTTIATSTTTAPPQPQDNTFVSEVKRRLEYTKANMDVFDYDESTIEEGDSKTIDVVCSTTVNNAPVKLKCNISGGDDDSIDSMTIRYDNLGEWIREYYVDTDCTIEKTSDEISEVDALNILRMFYASAILYTDVGLSSEQISDSCDILINSLERYKYTGDYLTDDSDSISVKCGDYVFLLTITPNGSNAIALSAYNIDFYNENMDLAGQPHYSGAEV